METNDFTQKQMERSMHGTKMDLIRLNILINEVVPKDIIVDLRYLPELKGSYRVERDPVDTNRFRISWSDPLIEELILHEIGHLVYRLKGSTYNGIGNNKVLRTDDHLTVAKEVEAWRFVSKYYGGLNRSQQFIRNKCLNSYGYLGQKLELEEYDSLILEAEIQKL